MKKYIFLFLLIIFTSSIFAQNLSISGSINTEDGASICDVTVYLVNSTDSSIPTQSFLTDETGTYQFDNLNAGDSYTIYAESTTNWRNGVSTFDFVLISKHILGEEEIQNPFVLYSLDVDHSNFLSVRDLVLIRRMILGLDDEFPRGNWQFFKTDITFPNPQRPWQRLGADDIKIGPLTTSITDANFVGYKIGDANFSAQPCEN